MYESYYGLSDKPFSMLPDPGYLFLSRKHETALTLLEYALMNSAGFCVITGEPGAGKTTLLRKLLESIGDDVAVGMITNTHKSFGELLDWVLSAYSIHEPGLNKVEKNQKFIDFLMEQYANNRTTLLIVDEAQNMHADTLEELRMLSNINSEKDQLLQIILAGQPQLKDTLRQPELMQFAQRIAVDYHLDALNLEETCGYIQHRLTVAGATNDVFTPKACEHIYQYSGGTPRLINLICDTALVYGFADQDETLDESIIDQMVQERMRDSVVPLFKEIEQGDGPVEAQPESADEIDFPWINPHGGTEGLKPEPTATATSAEAEPVAAEAEAEKKTVEETEAVVADVEHEAEDKASVDAEPETQPAEQVTKSESTTQEDTAPVAADEAAEPGFESNVDNDAVAETPDIFSQTLKLEAYQAAENKWRKPAIAALAVLAIAVVSAGVVYFDSKGEEQRQAERQLMMDRLERQQRMSSQLEDELQKLREQQEQQQTELEQQAQELQKERDEAIARAEEESRLRVKREKQVEQIRQQISTTEANLKREAEKTVQQEKAKQQQIAASKAKLEAELAQQRDRLNKLVLELEQSRQQDGQVQQAALESTSALSDVDVDAGIDEEPGSTDTAFKPDPCAGPQARFVSSCR